MNWQTNPYRLHPGISLTDSAHRAGVEEARRGAAQLGRLTGSRETKVHEARKSLKRIRTLLRLTHDLDQAELQESVRSLVRLASRSLAGSRDSDILPGVLRELLASAHRKDLNRSAQKLVAQNCSANGEGGLPDGSMLDNARHLLEMIAYLLNSRAYPPDLRPLFTASVAEIYARGQKFALKKKLSPSQLHTLRKAVKDLQHGAELVSEIDGGQALLKQARSLAEKLGEHQDLIVLEDFLKRVESVDEKQDADLQLLQGLLKTRRKELAGKAHDEARSYFQESPDCYAQRYDHLIAAVPGPGSTFAQPGARF